MASISNEAYHVKLYGLILCGGLSTRMGKDKDELKYHGIPQSRYMFELASNCCEQTFYSVREDQKSSYNGLPKIIDRDEYQGPLNGILSAHEEFPKVAWLVLACDLPLLNLPNIQNLVLQRDNSKNATVFSKREDNLPEPLVAIWEPKGLRNLKNNIAEKRAFGPRQFLRSTEIAFVYPSDENVLFNANSMEQFEQAQLHLKSKD
ncbi:NTP transferase domain-containing protein [Croceivirga thetidis]|uniref:Probable molybdenum cofactor guanylyltransferase n=1 Tax=Croceivirga thetidis TaxID=2721623 RepID=A0ABX1GTH2_9FLAO|nr:NTP transferase domain-containing protein [Croceivirga thetidis]NKI32305.1 NTP transferase domain-containing protein [Croceivirga thetidis]